MIATFFTILRVFLCYFSTFLYHFTHKDGGIGRADTWDEAHCQGEKLAGYLWGYSHVMNYEEEWKYVRNRITELRKARGWSIQALADYANMDRADLSRIESGRVTGIYLTTLCRLAEALDVSPAELVRK